MDYKPYLQVGEKKFSLEELYCLIIDRTVIPEGVTAEMLEAVGLGMGPTLCIDTEIGTIQAICHCASIGTQLQPHQNRAKPLRLTEAEYMHGGDFPLETFLYGRGDSYAARMPVDIRPGDQIENKYTSM